MRQSLLTHPSVLRRRLHLQNARSQLFLQARLSFFHGAFGVSSKVTSEAMSGPRPRCNLPLTAAIDRIVFSSGRQGKGRTWESGASGGHDASHLFRHNHGAVVVGEALLSGLLLLRRPGIRRLGRTST